MAGRPESLPSVSEGAATLGSFYRGVVCKLHRSPERGRIRTANGREIPFIFLHVNMIGTRRRFSDLREGMVVGYDVSWTAKGLRVSVIRIPEPADHDLKWELGAEEDESTHHLANEDGKDRDVE